MSTSDNTQNNNSQKGTKLFISDNEKRDIIKYIEQGKTLPEKYRFLLFKADREVELVWNGKSDEVANVVLPFQHIEQIDEPREGKEFGDRGTLFDFSGKQITGWTNKLIWGDNKLILSSLKNGPMRKEIEAQGGLKLIYIDPPFDVGADFSMDIQIGEGGDAESFTKKPSVIEEIAYRDTWGKGADSFIAMIYERLKLMYELLAEDGSIYVHCDWRLNSYMRLILDEIFGKNNFVNEIIWSYGGPSPVKTAYPRKHDTVLVYSKSTNYKFKLQYGDIPKYLYERAKKDDNGRLWVDQNLGKLKPETITQLREEGRIFETRTGRLRRKQYIDEMEGGQLFDVWDISIINSQAKEDLSYPTQKPEIFLERIIKTSSKNS